MTSTDYLIDIALIALVLIQVRSRPLDRRTLALPLISVAAAGSYYLKAFPTAGHDIALDVVLGAVGATLGVLCALATRVWRSENGGARAQAGRVAAGLWVVGVGSRLAFEEYTTHGGAPAVTRFSITHQITGADAWTTALVLMAFAEVLARLVVLHGRARRAVTADAAVLPARQGVTV